MYSSNIFIRISVGNRRIGENGARYGPSSVSKQNCSSLADTTNASSRFIVALIRRKLSSFDAISAGSSFVSSPTEGIIMLRCDESISCNSIEIYEHKNSELVTNLTVFESYVCRIRVSRSASGALIYPDIVLKKCGNREKEVPLWLDGFCCWKPVKDATRPGCIPFTTQLCDSQIPFLNLYILIPQYCLFLWVNQ